MPLLKPNVGRALSFVGGVVLICALFMIWYHFPPSHDPRDSTGWQTFTRLRWVVLGGAILTIGSALIAQRRGVLIARTLLGLLLAALIARRIISPPDISGISSQIGVYIGAIAGLCVALGGLVDSGRRVVEVYPAIWRQPVGQLGRGQQVLDRGDE